MTSTEVPTDLLTSALQLMSQEWTKLSQGDDPSTQASPELDIITRRVTALLLARLIAVVHDRDKDAPPCFPDYSTVSICRTLLVQPELWPASITSTVVEELQEYVGKMIEHYYPTGIVPYHNAEHAFHVTISMNKLLDMMLSRKFGEAVVPPSFGLRYQPMALFSMVFAALIHDVEHTGVANRVLATEDNPLAIQYNDQSIAENRSLFVAFDEFLSPYYKNFRQALVPQPEDYHLLRKHVIDLVLHTDIASPEKTQLGKSKWKEAFFDAVVRRRSMENSNAYGDKAGSPENGMKPNTSLASLNIRGGSSSQREGGGLSGDEQSLDTMLTESDEDTRASQEAIPEQAPPPAHSRRNYPNRTRSLVAPPTQPPVSAETKPTLRAMGNRKRLGIRRSMDLSGEVLDPYASKEPDDSDRATLLEADQPDELKMTVVMETIMQAADVAHNLQSWDHMVEWSCRLYLELRRAFIQNRGPDVSRNWFPNQLSFLELYLEPLAKKLETVGVFGSMVGPSFARIVKASRDRWLLDGVEVTQAVIDAGEEWFPEGESVEPLPKFNPRHGSGSTGTGGHSDSNGTSNGKDYGAEMTALQEELKQVKEKLDQATESALQGQRQADEHYQSTVALQETLDEKESSIHALREELAKSKNLQAKEQEQFQNASIKVSKQEEDLRSTLKEREELLKKLKHHEDKQDELNTKLKEQVDLQGILKRQEQQQQREIEKLIQHEHELKEKLRTQEKRKQEEMERLTRQQAELEENLRKQEQLRLQEMEKLIQHSNYLKKKLLEQEQQQQQEMEKLSRQQREEEERHRLETEKLRQQQRQVEENAKLKAIELEETIGAKSTADKWQTIAMMLMGLALLWTMIRAPILNNLCAPAPPGTKIFKMDTAVYESPWFASPEMKSKAFAICGARSRVRIENSKGKLSWTFLDKDSKTEILSKSFQHATIQHDGLHVVDNRGGVNIVSAVPWHQSV